MNKEIKDNSKAIKGFKKEKQTSLKSGKFFFDVLKGIKNLSKKFLTKQSKLMIAELELNTGDKEFFPVEVQSDKSFDLMGRKYLVDDNYLIYYRTFKMWGSAYHQDISLPIKQSVDVNAIKNVVNQNSLDDKVTSNLDPTILQNFVKSTVIQKVFAGAEMQDLFGFFKTLLIIVALISGVTAMGVMKLLGVF